MPHNTQGKSGAEYRSGGKVHTKRKRLIRQGPNPRSRDKPPEVIRAKPPVMRKFKSKPKKGKGLVAGPPLDKNPKPKTVPKNY